MQSYAIRRALQAIPLLIILSAILFLLVARRRVGRWRKPARNPNISAEQRALLRAQLGLDRPLPVQYFEWISGVARGDLGDSIKSNRPVSTMIWERLPNTLILVGTAFLITILIAIPLGAISALRQYSLFDNISTIVTFAGQSVPIYWFGLMLILIFYVWLDNPFTGGPLLPAGGMYTVGEGKSLSDLLWHMILPVGTLVFVWVAWYSRFFRASMLEVLGADYVRTAKSKGIPESRRGLWSRGAQCRNSADYHDRDGLSGDLRWRTLHRDDLFVAGDGAALLGGGTRSRLSCADGNYSDQCRADCGCQPRRRFALRQTGSRVSYE